ncbi:AAA family ATPase [Trinickia caryophylli]|uniref:Response regulator receiver protein n=1 Tax=Trinickia caryophylli TaxID=28094 RepID=A0A1X7CWX2_TRICW|nr:AAA family ATPase [Trinickia caryophylli]PMS13435.1 pilus assembly protein [Trinickia caryophylli]TRX13707.1 AAA family ATPase [Trinickia caryophylli]WQE15294.1 AAA family ATPase [Trinickia caryophylli]SMF04300.1 response regulator receiver protein [Trinickia caryophylli]GLU30954.1 pilus assembly-related protein [Trinickia caryophylli]
MIDILSISKDASRLAQIVRQIGECGSYRTTRAVGSPSSLAQRGDSLDAFDVLIVDAQSLDDAELAVVADLCRRYERMTCILLSDDASPETLIAAMRAGFRDVLAWPLEHRALCDALQRAESKRLQGATHETRIVSFISCKGGTGTTLIATNVAQAISKLEHQRVLLIDLNQLYGDAAFVMTSEAPPSTLPDVCAQIDRMDSAFLDASLLHVSETFHVLAGAGDPVKAAEVGFERLEWIIGIAIPRYDFVIFDLGQSINPLSMLALDRSDEIHMVLQASMPHVRAGRRLREILGSLGYGNDRLRLLLNRYSRELERSRTALEEVVDLTPYQVLPDDTAVVTEALDEGVPVSTIKRNCALSRALQQLAENIVAGAAAPARGKARSETRPIRFFGRVVTPKLKTM